MLAVKEDGYVRGLWNEGARRKAENGRLPGDGVWGTEREEIFMQRGFTGAYR